MLVTTMVTTTTTDNPACDFSVCESFSTFSFPSTWESIQRFQTTYFYTDLSTHPGRKQFTNIKGIQRKLQPSQHNHKNQRFSMQAHCELQIQDIICHCNLLTSLYQQQRLYFDQTEISSFPKHECQREPNLHLLNECTHTILNIPDYKSPLPSLYYKLHNGKISFLFQH